MYKATHTEACTYTMYTHIYVLATQFINNWRTTQARCGGCWGNKREGVCGRGISPAAAAACCIVLSYKYIFDDSIDWWMLSTAVHVGGPRPASAQQQRRPKVFSLLVKHFEDCWLLLLLLAGVREVLARAKSLFNIWATVRAYIISWSLLLQRGARWEGSGGRALAGLLCDAMAMSYPHQVANVERAGCRSGMHSNYEYRSLVDARKLTQRRGTRLSKSASGEIYIYIVWCWWWW
jgi:hypothetical protein